MTRVVLPGHLHLVVHTAQRGRVVFPDRDQRQRYLDALRDAARESQVAIHAYGLLDDEVRVLATPTTPSGLATMLQGVNRRYVPGLNRAFDTSGTPWAGRFRSAVIDPSSHFRAVLRFVEGGLLADGNPPAGDLASVRHHLGVEPLPLVAAHPGYWGFGNTPFEREAAYARWLLEDEDPGMAPILRRALGGWVVGSDAFVTEIGRAAKRRVSPEVAGRPSKRAAKPAG